MPAQVTLLGRQPLKPFMSVPAQGAPLGFSPDRAPWACLRKSPDWVFTLIRPSWACLRGAPGRVLVPHRLRAQQHGARRLGRGHLLLQGIVDTRLLRLLLLDEQTLTKTHSFCQNMMQLSSSLQHGHQRVHTSMQAH